MSNFGDSNNIDPFATDAGQSFHTQIANKKSGLSAGKIAIVAVASLVSVVAVIAVVLSLYVIGVNQQAIESTGDKNYDESSNSQGDSSNSNADTDYTGGDPLLYDLNSSGSIYWSEDPFNYLGSYPPLAIYLSDAGNDGSYCALWLYNSYEEAGQAADGGDFSNMDSPSTWGESTDGVLGFVLVADSQTTACATQAFKFLGY